MARRGEKSNIPVFIPVILIKALAGARIGSVSSYTSLTKELLLLKLIYDITILTSIKI
jgi:hypothetical protein